MRGSPRNTRGAISQFDSVPGCQSFQYRGLDGIDRRTAFSFSPAPQSLRRSRAEYQVSMAPGERRSIVCIAAFDCGATRERAGFFAALRQKRRANRKRRPAASVASGAPQFDRFMARSTADVYILSSRVDGELYPYAGIPWFNTVFGRDGIITAMLMLWFDASIARGVLKHLADRQARVRDPSSDAEPGKILHERRECETAMLGEVPFRCYYGAVDSTPLFIMLAGMYYRRTGDAATIRELWPNITAALRWCDVFGDRDGDGFVEYHRETKSGLANQGWKDSHDSIFHAGADLARGPIALVEVQGYVYAAKVEAAELAKAFGDDELAARLAREAAALKQKFNEVFWVEGLGAYGLALDGRKKLCEVRSSNIGHALFCGIVDPEKAEGVRSALMNRSAFSGWGVRTIAAGEARYNPMSYHNGSIWPHDNAIIALGLTRYGFRADANRIFEAIFDAATHQHDGRLPELFCGFVRKRGMGPVAYPIACSPQAWAAAAPFGLLQASLNFSIEQATSRITFTSPSLPHFLDEIVLRRIAVGGELADFRLRRTRGDAVEIEALQKNSNIELVVA